MNDKADGLKKFALHPFEFSTMCLAEEIGSDRLATVELSPSGNSVSFGMISLTNPPLPGRPVRTRFTQRAFLRSVACEGCLIFFEAPRMVWELSVLPDLLDVLARMRPARLGQRERNLLFVTPASAEVEQFVLEAGDRKQIALLSPPSAASIRSIRTVPDLGILVGIGVDEEGVSKSILSIPHAGLTYEQVKNPACWKRLAFQPSGIPQMLDLSCPVASRDSIGFPRATFVVSLADEREISLTLVKEAPTEFRASWGDPVAVDAQTIAPARAPNHVMRYRSGKSSSTIEVANISEAARHYQMFLPS